MGNVHSERDEELKKEIIKFFYYNSDTGILTWKCKPSMCVSVGDIAGHSTAEGYRRVRFHKQNFNVHRIAWLLYYDKWPEYQIDHINGDRSDNRICNLRDVLPRINQQNRIEHRNGRYLGVDKLKNKWKARIVINGRGYSLGHFSSETDATQAYSDACTMLESNPDWVPPKIENIALGCSYKPKLHKWQAAIQLHGESVYLGLYNTKEEAHAVYLKAYNRKKSKVTRYSE